MDRIWNLRLFHIKSTKAQSYCDIGWEVPFKVQPINWKQARRIDSWDLRIKYLSVKTRIDLCRDIDIFLPTSTIHAYDSKLFISLGDRLSQLKA